MNRLVWFAFFVLLGLRSAAALEMPLHPTESRVVKRHGFVASQIARTATGEAAEEWKKAIAEFEASKKSSN